MKRARLSRRGSRKNFFRGRRIHKKNLRLSPLRADSECKKKAGTSGTDAQRGGRALV